MKLADLEPQFIRHEVKRELVSKVKPEIWAVRKDGPFSEEDFHEVETDVEHSVYVDTLAEADGILFLCPKCFRDKGRAGTHSVICWFEDKVADNVDPKPGRWFPQGTGYTDLSFVPHKKSNSVLLQGEEGCKAHFLLTNGEIQLI